MLVVLLFIVIQTILLYKSFIMLKQNIITDNKNGYDEILSPAEIERVKRRKTFDARINRIKDELANSCKEEPAFELHPAVKNLPHEIIKQKYDILPDVEYAD